MCSQLFLDSFHTCLAPVPHIDAKRSSVVLCSDLGDVVSMMGTRNPNMCEAARLASDLTFVCSYKQLMVCILACAPAFSSYLRDKSTI